MRQQSGLRRFWQFCRTTYAPLFHLAFAALWGMGLLAYFGAATPATAQMPLGSELLLSIVTMLVVLFFLRVVDEIKDYEYDCVHNPDRPLVTGAVSRRDLHLYIAGAALVTAVLNLWASLPLLLLLVVEYVWGYALIFVERLWPRVRDGMFLAQLFTFPVNILLSVYLLFVFAQVTVTSITPASLWGILFFSSAFLHFEYSRKCAWPHQASPTERLYLQEVGLPAALGLVLLTAVVACVGTVVVLAPWRQEGAAAVTGYLPLLPLVVAGRSMKRFFAVGRQRAPRQVHALKPGATLFLTGYYLAVVIHGIAAGAFS